jgi:hypothetical protein
MFPSFFHGDWAHLFGDHSGQSFVKPHAKRADALATKADSGGEHQVGAIGFQQVGGTDVGMEAPGDQGDDVHERFRGLAPFLSKGTELVEGEDVINSGCFYGLVHFRFPSARRTRLSSST